MPLRLEGVMTDSEEHGLTLLDPVTVDVTAPQAIAIGRE